MRRAVLVALAAVALAGPAAAQDRRHDNRRWIEGERRDRERDVHRAHRRAERDAERAYEERMRRERWRRESGGCRHGPQLDRRW